MKIITDKQIIIYAIGYLKNSIYTHKEFLKYTDKNSNTHRVVQDNLIAMEKELNEIEDIVNCEYIKIVTERS